MLPGMALPYDELGGNDSDDFGDNGDDNSSGGWQTAGHQRQRSRTTPSEVCKSVSCISMFHAMLP